MNNVVCVKYVPDVTVDRRFESDNTVDRIGVDGLLSDPYECAVKLAMQLKELVADDTEVTGAAAPCGPRRAPFQGDLHDVLPAVVETLDERRRG